MLDRVVHRKNIREELVSIIRMLTKQPRAIKADIAGPIDQKKQDQPVE